MPCAPDLWQQLSKNEKVALRQFQKAMVSLPDSLKTIPKEKVISVSRCRDGRPYKIECNLPRARTREEFLELAAALVWSSKDPFANERQAHCLLAALIAYQREFNVNLEGKDYKERNGFETVLMIIARGEGWGGGEEAYLNSLFTEVETGYRRRGSCYLRSALKRSGVPIHKNRRPDGASGFDESQSLAVSLYHEHLRFEGRVATKWPYLSSLKDALSIYAPLVSSETRRLLLDYRKKPVKVTVKTDESESRVRAAYVKIEQAMRSGVEVDLFEGFRIDAIAACVSDERIAPSKKDLFVEELEGIARRMQEELDPNSRLKSLYVSDEELEEEYARRYGIDLLCVEGDV